MSDPKLIPSKEIGLTAGIVKTPGIDDVLLAIEAEQDIVEANQRLLEGRRQTGEEMDLWRWLITEIREQCNRRLAPHDVFLAAAAANPNGLGACFVGVDRERRTYEVTLNLPPKERDDFENASKETFVRWAIDAITSEIVEQKRIYMHRMGRD